MNSKKEEAIKYCHDIQKNLDKLNSMGFSLDLGDGIFSIFDNSIKVDYNGTFGGANEHRSQVIFDFSQYVKAK